jgi:hypothetical protein
MKWKTYRSDLSQDQLESLVKVSNRVSGVIFIEDSDISSHDMLLYSILEFNIKYPEVWISCVSESGNRFSYIQEFCCELGIEKISFYDHREIVRLIENKNTFQAIFLEASEDLPIYVINKLVKSSNKLVLISKGFSHFVTHPIWKESPIRMSEISHVEAVEVVKIRNLNKINSSVYNLFQSGFQETFVFIPKDKLNVGLYKLQSHLDEVLLCWEMAVSRKNANESVGIVLPNDDLLIHFVNILLLSQNKTAFTVENSGRDFSLLCKYLILNSIDAEIYGCNSPVFFKSQELGKVIFSTYSEFRNFDFDTVYLPFLGISMVFDDKVINHRVLFSKVLLNCLGAKVINAYYSDILNSEIDVFFEECEIKSNFNRDLSNNDLIF